MRTPSTLIAAVFLSAPTFCIAQAYGELNIGDVRARFHAHGLIGNNLATQAAAFEVPNGGGVHALYSAGLWVAGMSSDNQLKLAAMKYESGTGSDYYTGPLTVDGLATTNATMMAAYDQVFSVTSEEVAQHLAYHACLADPSCDPATAFPGYQTPLSITNWPAVNGAPGFATFQAPFIDVNQDGDYDPAAGDAPCILGDQALYFVFNDKGGPHLLTGGQPIGIEVQAMAFAYDSGDPYLDQTVFVHYHLINRGTQTLSNARIGMFNDFDLGCGDDDVVGTDAARNLTYVYNGDEIDQACLGAMGYGAQPPAFGMAIVKGPYRDDNAVDQEDPNELPAWNGTGFGDGVIDNEKHGLSSAMHMYRQGDPCCTDPVQSSHYYNYLRGIWKDGVPLAYGASGYPVQTTPTSCLFSFPGDSDPDGVGIPDGSLVTPWSDTYAPVSPDRRTIASMGPFTLEPGAHHDLLLAYVYARAGSGGALASVQALQSRVDSVIDFAQTLPLWSNMRETFQGGCEEQVEQGLIELGEGALRFFPVPASTSVQIESHRELIGAVLIIRDATGRVVMQQRVLPDRNTIDVSALARGVYMCEAVARNARFTGRIVKE